MDRDVERARIEVTPNGGRVQIRLERINSHVEVTVSDTGQRVSKAFLSHLFDRFRQPTKRRSKQLGDLDHGSDQECYW